MYPCFKGSGCHSNCPIVRPLPISYPRLLLDHWIKFNETFRECFKKALQNLHLKIRSEVWLRGFLGIVDSYLLSATTAPVNEIWWIFFRNFFVERHCDLLFYILITKILCFFHRRHGFSIIFNKEWKWRYYLVNSLLVIVLVSLCNQLRNAKFMSVGMSVVNWKTYSAQTCCQSENLILWYLEYPNLIYANSRIVNVISFLAIGLDSC